MDVVRLAKQLGIADPAVVRKARELAGLAAVRFAGGMGQAEVCVGAVCLELACQALQVSNKELTRDKFVRHGCVNPKVYTQTFNMLHQALDVNRKIDLQHLVVQFGCASVRQTVTRVMNLYKDRFLAKLPDEDRAKASFARPVFLAAAFYLVAKKHKIKVDLRSLLETMCVSREDYLDISASMYQLCFDVVGVEKTKKRATERKTHTSVLDAHRHQQPPAPDATAPEAGSSGQAQATVVQPAVARTRSAKRARDEGADSEEWKLLALSGLAAAAPGSKGRGDADGDGEEDHAKAHVVRPCESSGARCAGDENTSQPPAAMLGPQTCQGAERAGQGKQLKQAKLVLTQRQDNTMQLHCS